MVNMAIPNGSSPERNLCSVLDQKFQFKYLLRITNLKIINDQVWTIINKTPFAADYSFTQDDKNGELVWMVAVKATFAISPADGKLTIAEEQVELNKTDEFRGDPLYTSLLKTNDFVLNKPEVDILLEAKVFSFEEKPVRELMVGFALGKLKKILKVTGNHYYERFLGFLIKTLPSPFKEREIIYENAFGGWMEASDNKNIFYETRNPAGKGYAKNRWFLADVDIPNIEYPGFPTRKKAKKNKIAGFGPIAAHWSPRLEYAGTINEETKSENTTIRPPDFNPLYYQYAPADQRLKEIKGGEPVSLLNTHPRHPEICFELPEIEITLETMMDNKIINHPAKVHTILIEPDKLKLQMVWQGNVTCAKQGKTLEYTRINHQINAL